MDFRTTHAFSVKKADNIAILAAGEIANCWIHHNSLCKEKNKHWMTSYVLVYKAKNHVTPPHMSELSLTPILVV
jgi:hypothetical protein